ncbi:MAG: hypothetical protein P8179_08700 [Candidatus Thiodiazotropha sp.]
MIEMPTIPHIKGGLLQPIGAVDVFILIGFLLFVGLYSNFYTAYSIPNAQKTILTKDH